MFSAGCAWCRHISVKPGDLKPKTVPPRYLGQPSPFTHPHLVKHGECLLSSNMAALSLRIVSRVNQKMLEAVGISALSAPQVK